MCIRCCPIKQNARNLLKFRPLKFEVIAAFFFKMQVFLLGKKIYTLESFILMEQSTYTIVIFRGGFLLRTANLWFRKIFRSLALYLLICMAIIQGSETFT